RHLPVRHLPALLWGPAVSGASAAGPVSGVAAPRSSPTGGAGGPPGAPPWVDSPGENAVAETVIDGITAAQFGRTTADTRTLKRSPCCSTEAFACGGAAFRAAARTASRGSPRAAARAPARAASTHASWAATTLI